MYSPSATNMLKHNIPLPAQPPWLLFMQMSLKEQDRKEDRKLNITYQENHGWKKKEKKKEISHCLLPKNSKISTAQKPLTLSRSSSGVGGRWVSESALFFICATERESVICEVRLTEPHHTEEAIELGAMVCYWCIMQGMQLNLQYNSIYAKFSFITSKAITPPLY